MSNESKISAKVQEVVNEGRRVPIVYLNGSAATLPEDNRQLMGELMLDLETGTHGETIKLPSSVLLKAVADGPEFPEGELVEALHTPRSDSEGGLEAIRAQVRIGEIMYMIAIVDTQPELKIPYSRIGIIYDYPKS